MDAKLEGYNESEEAERINTQRAEKRAENAENRIKELEALLEKKAPTQK